MQHQLLSLWVVLLFLFYLQQGGAFLLPTTATKCHDPGTLAIAAGSDSGWKPDNVYEDIEDLRNAIAKDRAEDNLRVFQTQELLDTFAANRRPLLQDIKNYVIFPCLLISMMASLSLMYRPLLFGLGNCLRKLSVFEFWTIEVAMPMLFLMQKYRGKYGVSIDYLPLNIRTSPLRNYIATGEESSRLINSCQDFTLCLLEQWVFAVFGTSCLGLCSLVFCRYQNSHLWPFVRFITRLGSISSLHLYPVLLFKLRRQPHPQKRTESTSRQISDFMLKFGTMGLIIDLYEIMIRARVPLVLLSLLASLTSFLNPKNIFSKWNHHEKLGIMKLIGLQAVNWSPCVFAFFLFYHIPSNAIQGLVLPLLLSCLSPFLYILALKNRVGITFSDNLPLNSTVWKGGNEGPDHLSHKQWRYQVLWKEPKRLGEVISGIIGAALISGNAMEKVRKKFPLFDIESLPKNIVDWIDFRRNEFEELPQKSKDAAMEELAEEHEKDYQEGKFRDPLGIAVQQTFGIGLGFADGHMDPLPPNEEPGLERLQARVAKSAIKRVNEIYDEAINEDLDSIVDELERETRKAQIREKNKAEIQYLKTQLVELVPRKYKGNLSKPFKVNVYGLRNLRRIIEDHTFPYPPYKYRSKPRVFPMLPDPPEGLDWRQHPTTDNK